MFNDIIEAQIDCNVLTGGFIPKPGMILCGDAGIEFEGINGARQLCIAWNEIALVRVEVFRGDVRELAVHTDVGQVITLVPNDGAALVRAMGSHLGRDTFVAMDEVATEELNPLEKLRDRLRCRESGRQSPP
ncbi:DUF956 family protein [Olsenella massiliensis]|uniref:DUF956 family protein n=1 Tax=Olsenella massiliensis TaxID=1622075 RepID=UPI00071E47DD|nr:DUF956 family protein [Olsenella massiliensis]